MGSDCRPADVYETAERLRNGKSTFAYGRPGGMPCTVHLGPFPAEDPAR